MGNKTFDWVIVFYKKHYKQKSVLYNEEDCIGPSELQWRLSYEMIYANITFIFPNCVYDTDGRYFLQYRRQ